MSDDLNTEIKIGADASGVEAGVGKAKRSLKSLSDAAQQAGEDAGAGMGAIGAGGDKSAKDVERATRTMQNSIQRLIAEQKAGAKGSREYWEALANTRGVNTADLRPLLDQLDAARSATNAARDAAESWRESLGEIGPMVAAAFSGAALAGFIGKVVSVQREFDVLNSSLKTVTGSSAAAEREMAWLKDFAKETPFGLAQATQGFVNMKALGLDPTRAALTSFGNIASATGKDLDQMIEAVADASTGEFERLKEFGIKAKKEGDQVSLTFQGVTTTIQNSAADITKYLENLGNTSFGGAMEERAKTLDGTIAALGDTWDELFRTVSTNNVGGLIFDSVTLANGALEDATTILRAMGGAAQDASRDTGALSTIQNGIATVFETVAVLGANLKFVLVGIGTEIGGLAAQVAQAAQFNFAGVRTIREQMVADAEAARREIDATTARILNARKEQEEYARYATRNASAATDPRRVDLGGSTTRKPVAGVDSKGINAANKELADQAKLIAELNGLTGSFAKDWDTLSAVYKKGEMSLEQLTSAQAALLEKQPAIKAFADEQAKAQQALDKANLDAAASREKYLTSLSTGLDKIQADIAAQIEATERMGLSKEAIAELDAAKLEMLATDLELQAIKAMDRNLDQQTYDALMAQAKAYRELGNAKRAGAARGTAVEEAKKAADEWQRTSEQINSTLTDALMRGFESGKDFAKNMRDTVVNMFKTMVLRPVVSAIVGPISGALLGGMGLATAAQAGQGGASSGVSTALSGASLLGSVGGSLAAGAGWLTGATTLGGSLSAGMSLLGTGSLAGAGAGLGMLAGALGPIALGIGLLSSMFSRKLKDQGIEGTLGGEVGFEGQQYRFYKGGLFRSDKTVRSELDPKLDSGLDAAVRQMQQSMRGLADSFSLPTEAITGFTQSIKLSFNGLDEAGIQAKIQEALTGYNEALAGAFIESMESSDVPAWVDRLIGNTDASAVQRLQDVAEWPARLLQSFGTSRDAMVQQFAEGLATGDAAAAGRSVADTLVASIQNAVLTNAAGQIFDIVNQGIVTPMLDAIATGASVADVLSQATIDKTIERAKAQAQALAELYGNAEFAAAMEQLRTAVGGALGQAGSYLQALPKTLVATQQIDTAAQDAARAADEAQKAWQQITDGLLRDQASLKIDLLRAQGREEEALAAERTKAIEGYDEYQIALYDSNQALRDQITELERMAEVSRTLASELPAVLDKFRTPEQRTKAQYSSIAGDLVGAGLSGADVGSLAGALESMSKDQIAQAAAAIYNMAGVTDDMRLALVRAAGGLADLKDAAEAPILSERAGLQEQLNRLTLTTTELRALEVAKLHESNRPLQERIYLLEDEARVTAERAGLMTSLFQTLGNTGALRAEKLEGIDPSNRPLQQKIWEIEDAKAALEKALGAEKTALDAAHQAAQERVSDLQSVFDTLKSNVQSLYNTVAETNAAQAAQGVAFIDRALSAARSTGYMPDSGELSDAIGRARGGLDKEYASEFDRQRDTLVLAGKLAELQDLTGGQLTVAEQQLNTAKSQLTVLEDSQAQGRAMLESLSGNVTATMSVAEAIQRLSLSLGKVTELAIYGGSTFSGAPTGSSFDSGTLARARAVKKAWGKGDMSDEDFVFWARANNVPQFAVGTNYVPRDMLAQIHEGEAIVPKAYNPAAGGTQSNARLEALIEGLTSRVQALQSELVAIKTNTGQMAENIDNVTEGGNAMRVA